MAGDLFDGSLTVSILGAAWGWLLALLTGASLLPRREDDAGGASLLTWLVIGVAVQAQLWLALGLLGMLRPAVVLGAAAVATLVGALVGGPRIRAAARALSAGRSDVSVRWLGGAAWLALGAFLLVVFRLALWPTVFYDDLVYHVGVPRQALLTGSWPAMPGLHYSFMPAGWDALYVLPLALGGGNGPQLMNLIALGLWAWAVWRLALHGGGPAVAAAATALLVIAPVTGSLGAFAGNDLFVGLALTVALERLLATRAERPLTVGLLAGAAWGAKYSALPAAAGIALAAALHRAGSFTRRLAGAAVIGAVTLALPLAWTLRSLVLTGNPVYPAFFGLFGGRYWSAESAAVVAGQVSHGGLGDRGPAAFVLALGDLLFRSDTLGYPSGINALFVVLGLLGLALWRRVRGGGALLVVLAVSYAGWCVTSLNLRYALVLLAALAPFAAAVIEAGTRTLSRVVPGPAMRALAPLLLLLAVAGPFAGAVGRHLSLYDMTLFGGPSRGELHATRLHLAAAGRAMARELPADARVLLVGEGRVALLPRPALASSAYDRSDIARLIDGASSVDEVNRRLAGFTHVVVNYRELSRFREHYGFAERFAPGDWTLFRNWLAEGLEPVGRYGNVVVYRVPGERS